MALTQLGLAVPALLHGADEGAPLHVAHEVGSLDVALAVGFFAAAHRPSRARGMLPLAGAAAILLTVTAGADLASGDTAPLHELPHGVDVVGFALLWVLFAVAPGGGGPAGGRVSSGPAQVVQVSHPRCAGRLAGLCRGRLVVLGVRALRGGRPSTTA